MNTTNSSISINPRFLVAIYMVLPLSLLFIAADTFFLGSSIKRVLPLDPRVFVWFVIIFMIPHILASFFSFADSEYARYYGSKLLRGAQIAVILGLFIPALTGATIIPLVIFAAYTMIHVFMQQSGISKSLMRNVTPEHVYWQNIGIVISIAIYAYLLVPKAGLRGAINTSALAIALVAIFALIYTVFALRIIKKSKTRTGKIYFLGSHMVPLSAIFYIITGYPILALIVPRVIHDSTAYTFYITHDHNRYKQKQTNFIYNLSTKIKLPIYIANPLISILAAYAIARFNSALITVILTCVIFLHYYMESYIWKNGALHRLQIRYSNYE